MVEVAVYPDSEIEIDNSDFTLQISGLDAEFQPTDPALIAAGLEQTAPAQRQIGLVPYGSTGYESSPKRYDTHGNRRYRGVRSSVGVGVSLDRNPPASTSRDRDVMEQELKDKGLPLASPTPRLPANSTSQSKSHPRRPIIPTSITRTARPPSWLCPGNRSISTTREIRQSSSQVSP